MCFGSHPKERLISKVPHLTKGLFTQCYCSQRTVKTEIVESNISGDVVGGIVRYAALPQDNMLWYMLVPMIPHPIRPYRCSSLVQN